MSWPKGTVLVPKETPYGPPAAREAWADALGQLLVVVDIWEREGDVAVNCPTDGRTYKRLIADVAQEYEPATGDPQWGRSWAATIDRCATEAARAGGESFEATAGWWRRVTAAAIRAFEEEKR